MNNTFTASEVRESVAQWRWHALTVSEKVAVMAMLSAFADRLEADEKAEAVAVVDRNASGQIRLATPGGDTFDISRYVGARLYTHPQPAQDEKDAARYRWLRDAPQELVEVYFATDKNPTGWGDWNSWKDKDAGIDTHMAKESGR